MHDGTSRAGRPLIGLDVRPHRLRSPADWTELLQGRCLVGATSERRSGIGRAATSGDAFPDVVVGPPAGYQPALVSSASGWASPMASDHAAATS